MADNLPTAAASDSPPNRIGRWKGVIDMLFRKRTKFQKRTGNTPSLYGIQDGHKEGGPLRSDSNQAPDLSLIANRAQKDHCDSQTSPGVAAQSRAQHLRWGGPGGKKMLVSMPKLIEAHANPYRKPNEIGRASCRERVSRLV